MLATKNLVKGNQCYNERLVQLNGEEYRIWKHYRSKLAAGIIHGLEILPIIKKSRILYLGASQGITASHVSDMIGFIFFLLDVTSSWSFLAVSCECSTA